MTSLAMLAGVATVGAAGGLAMRHEQEAQQTPRFDVPDGFAVEQVYTHEQVGSVVALSFDSHGRMVIAKEFGQVVTMIPGPNGAVEQRVFTDSVTNSQGLNFDGPDLLVTGVGPKGIGMYRVVDTDGDARGDRIEEIGTSNRRMEDHGTHNMVWGPDGFLYWANGNVSGMYETVSPLSPVRSYEDASIVVRLINGWNTHRTPGGKVYRKDVARNVGAGTRQTAAQEAGDDWELFAHGFRNIYDTGFNLQGELFTYDSDNEPDLGNYWYRPTRTDHVIPGGDYGYREPSSIHPDYYFDDTPQLEIQNRGSPTGVVVLQTYNYPREYWDVPLFADWSRGRILQSRLVRNGATYKPTTSNFVFGTPLNVGDIDVGPDGNLYFALGGRSTHGGIYRIVYKGPNAMQKPAATTPLERVLTMIQPRSAYSRELAQSTRAQMGNAWGAQLTAVVRNAQAAPERRVRALELLQVFGPAPDEALLTTLSRDATWEVRAAAAYDLGLKPTDTARRALVTLLHDGDPMVQRRAAEALLRAGLTPTIGAPLDPVADVFPMLASPDPMVRYAGRTVLQQVNVNRWKEAAIRLPQGEQAYHALLAYVEQIRSPDMYDFSRFLSREVELLRANPSDAQLLELVRLIEYTMSKDQGVTNFPIVGSTDRVGAGQAGATGGAAFGFGGGAPGGGAPGGGGGGAGAPGGGGGAGGAARPAGAPGGGGPGGGGQQAYAEIGNLLLSRFPAADWRLNREIARVLAYVQLPAAVPKLAAELGKTTDPEQRMAYADMLSRFENGWDDASIEQMTKYFESGARGWGVTASRDDFLRRLPEAKATLARTRINAAIPQTAALPGGPGGGGQNAAAGPMTQEQVETLVFGPASFSGNLDAGAAAFQKAGCIACHTFGPIGTQVGPDLTTAAQRYNRRDLVEAIVHPSASINDQYQAVAVTRTDGQTVLGLPAGDNAQGITLKLAGGAEVSIPAAQIRSRAPSNVSLMPEGLLNGLTGAERISLLLMLERGPSALPDSAVTRINGNR